MKAKITVNAGLLLALLLAALAMLFFWGTRFNDADLLVHIPGQANARVSFKSWLKENPMPADKNIHPVELTRTALSSISIVRVQGREPLHTHAKHDLVVTLLRGRGDLILGERTLKLLPGRTAFIPAGTPHAFINKSKQPSAARVVSSPPYDPRDFVETKP